MKHIQLFILFICVNHTVFCQTSQWTKENRSLVYSSLLKHVSQYTGTSKEQSETIALCALDEITKKYSPTEYESKIDIEITRIQGAAIQQCSKNMDINLNTAVKETKPVIELWSKEAKNDLYQEIVSSLSDNELTETQKEKIASCFVDDFTNSFTKEQVNNFLIEELKKQKNDYLKQCFQKSGITVSIKKEKNLSKRAILGCWNSFTYKLCFLDGGYFEKKNDKGIFKSSEGKWFIDQEKLILRTKKESFEYKVLYYDDTSLKLEDASGTLIRFTKMKELSIKPSKL